MEKLPNDFLTLDEVCNLFGSLFRSPGALRRAIAKHGLTTYKAGGQVMVSRGQFEREVMERMRVQPKGGGVVIAPRVAVDTTGLSPQMVRALRGETRRGRRRKAETAA